MYWANTSANTLISNLLQSANPDIRSEFEELLRGNSIHKTINEHLIQAVILLRQNRRGFIMDLYWD